MIVIWVTDNQSCLEASLCLLYLKGPFLAPQVLEGEQGVPDLVVVLDRLLAGWLFDQVLRELLHWHRYSVEQVARPCD